MPITENIQLPTFDELDVQDVNISAPVLLAAGTYFGAYCDLESKEYMLCKLEEKDPRKCLTEGKALTMCGHDFFNKVGATCKTEVERVGKCMEWSDRHIRMFNCHKDRKIMQQCLLEKLDMRKPEFGHFTQLRVHETQRPKPKSYATEFKHETVGIPKNFKETIDSKLGPKHPYYGDWSF